VRESIVFSNPGEVVAHTGFLKRIGVVVQSTQDMAVAQAGIDALLKK